MEKDRALEIYQLGLKWSNWSNQCTPEEHRYINRMWDTMPGYTCFYDALVRICKGEKPPVECSCCNNTGKIINANQLISCPVCNIQFINYKEK